jgi:hypothetical protein
MAGAHAHYRSVRSASPVILPRPASTFSISIRRTCSPPPRHSIGAAPMLYAFIVIFKTLPDRRTFALVSRSSTAARPRRCRLLPCGMRRPRAFLPAKGVAIGSATKLCAPRCAGTRTSRTTHIAVRAPVYVDLYYFVHARFSGNAICGDRPSSRATR